MALSAEDVVAIQQLCARYNHAVDAGDGEGFAAMFVEEGTLKARGVLSGRRALADFAAGVPSGAAKFRHIASNIVVDGDGAAATVTAYLHVWATAEPGGSPALITSGQYSDVLARLDGSWLFVSRVFTAD
jgi:uncharacterized protein (TIGR02246 family)